MSDEHPHYITFVIKYYQGHHYFKFINLLSYFTLITLTLFMIKPVNIPCWVKFEWIQYNGTLAVTSGRDSSSEKNRIRIPSTNEEV